MKNFSKFNYKFSIYPDVAESHFFQKKTGNCSDSNILYKTDRNSIEDCALECYNTSFCVSFTYSSRECSLFYKQCKNDVYPRETYFKRKEAGKSYFLIYNYNYFSIITFFFILFFVIYR